MLSQDVRYAWRTMRQNATLTATIVVTLGLGIGANTAVFSVVNTIALKTPLSVPAGDQLYTVNSGRYVTFGAGERAVLGTNVRGVQALRAT